MARIERADLRDVVDSNERAGRYDLLFQVASGGMGAVWAACLRLDLGFEKLFAVKTLLTDLEDDSGFREMFLDEARLAAGITHPNVAQIVDLGGDDDRLYLVMEWIEGVSLKQLGQLAARDGRRIPSGVLLRVLADACAGLHAIHEHVDRDGVPLEIVHRDVSPHNILVTVQGNSKVCDLGVAIARERLSETTQVGTLKGKLRFMSPEHAAGAPVDRRADVWGIGAVLYAALAGHPPYEAATDIGVLRRLLECEPPPPIESIPAPLQRVLDRALAVDPSDRHPTTADLADDLDRAARELGSLASHRDVAAFVIGASGDVLAARKEAIRRALDLRDSLLADETPPVSGLQPRAAVRSSGIIALTAPGSEVADTTRVAIPWIWVRWGLAALAVASVAIAAAVIVARTATRPAPIAEATATSAVLPLASDAPILVAAPPVTATAASEVPDASPARPAAESRPRRPAATAEDFDLDKILDTRH